MGALLWKEFRENSYKVAAGLGVVFLLHLLRQIEDFNRSFANDINGWAPIIAGLSAGILGMDVIAGERSRGTLEFLLVRPASLARIIAAKFIVGAVGLFVIVAAFWAVVYVTPFVGPMSPFGGRASFAPHGAPSASRGFLRRGRLLVHGRTFWVSVGCSAEL